jgi:sterol desaturase/sphingolipid hydroxylase (fatty acid hydroxylase superfamily)
LLHTVPFVWRWTHQMHHSAERVDVGEPPRATRVARETEAVPAE